MLKCTFIPGSVTRKPVSGVPVLGQALVFVPRVAGEPGQEAVPAFLPRSDGQRWGFPWTRAVRSLGHSQRVRCVTPAVWFLLFTEVI